ncbi:DUF4148 domain-containing protein [Noviherbaspirillum sp.]|uniref:DUF4148 domain-containing protein n=1 Tax=Noviherbaspirillum sp. TaxID=1926288 RepID=UPI002FE17D37
MKTIKQVAVIAGVLFATATTGAFADDKWTGNFGSNWQDHIQSTKSRAEVIAELNEARAAGLLIGADNSTYPRDQTIATNRVRSDAREDIAAKAMQDRSQN